MEIIGLIIAGIIIGALARLVLPGKQDINIIVTIILGIIGVLLGYWISGLLGVGSTDGVDWLRWIISIIVAAILVVGYGMVMGKRSATT